MVERRSHAFNFHIGDAGFFGCVSPTRNNPRDIRGNLPRLIVPQPKIFTDLEGELDRRAWVVGINRCRQYARFHVDRNWIHVVSGRESPSSRPRIKKAVIAIVALFSGNLSAGKQEDRSNRWVVAAFAPIGC
jgi:hypothetical protein